MVNTLYWDFESLPDLMWIEAQVERVMIHARILFMGENFSTK